MESPGERLPRSADLGYDRAPPLPEAGARKINAQVLAVTIAHLLDAKKADDIQVFDVAERLRVADYFVVCTGQSRAHVRGIYEELHVRLKAHGERHLPVQGADLGWWVVVDFSDVVVHILQPDARSFYDLDRLYDECPRVDWSAARPALPIQAETEELTADL
jgi:ribosome-associated protein